MKRTTLPSFSSLLQKMHPKRSSPSDPLLKSVPIFRLVALLLLLQGVILLAVSVGARYGVELGLDRYQQSTGRLIRAFNSGDQKNYNLLLQAKQWIFPLRMMAVIFLSGGALSFWRPLWSKPLWRLLRIEVKKNPL